jgi:hypothetical protein
MYLFKTGTPRKTDRKRCVRKNAKHKAKNRRRRRRLTRD